MIKVSKLFIKGGAAQKAAAFYDFLPPAARARADKKKNPEEKRRTLCCLYLLDKALRSAGLDISGLYYNKKGKPCIKDGYISLSHKGNLCVCAVSDAPVGIDVEKITDRIPKTVSRFSEKEKEHTGDSAERFYTVWTAKEAAAKLTGEGLSSALKTGPFDKRFAFSYNRINNYIITVCSYAETGGADNC